MLLAPVELVLVRRLPLLVGLLPTMRRVVVMCPSKVGPEPAPLWVVVV